MKKITLFTLLLLIFADCETQTISKAPTFNQTLAESSTSVAPSIVFVNTLKDTAITLPVGTTIVVYDFTTFWTNITNFSVAVEGLRPKQVKSLAGSISNPSYTGFKVSGYAIYSMGSSNLKGYVTTLEIVNNNSTAIKGTLNHSFAMGGQ